MLKTTRFKNCLLPFSFKLHVKSKANKQTEKEGVLVSCVNSQLIYYRSPSQSLYWWWKIFVHQISCKRQEVMYKAKFDSGGPIQLTVSGWFVRYACVCVFLCLFVYMFVITFSNVCRESVEVIQESTWIPKRSFSDCIHPLPNVFFCLNF